MKFVFSILTAFWAGFATPSPLPAEDHAESRMRLRVKERTPHEPSGLSPVSPYVRGKTPVVFVHGLWARPSSWRPMIEALAGRPRDRRPLPVLDVRLRDRQPHPLLGVSASQGPRRGPPAARPGKDRPRARPDGARRPQHGRPALQDGRRRSRRSALAGGQRPPRRRAERARPTTSSSMRDCLIFGPSLGVRRVVYIATPHRGSRIDSGSVQAIGTWLVSLPDPLRAAHHRLVAENPPDFFREPFRKVLPSSIDELEWDSPILTAPLGAGPPGGPEGPFDHRGLPRLTTRASNGRPGEL